ncbi:MAG TPA: hypothetical protein VKQ05_03415 [Gemmatimonadales bacterium]|nr:hypothetical protein [Gemmatimonadales bacterium]
MSKTIDYQFGDPCPACGGTLRKAPQPTEEQRRLAANREDPVFIPPHYDTAPKRVVDELGELWRCPECGYPHRFHPEAAKTATAATASAQKPGPVDLSGA